MPSLPRRAGAHPLELHGPRRGRGDRPREACRLPGDYARDAPAPWPLHPRGASGKNGKRKVVDRRRSSIMMTEWPAPAWLDCDGKDAVAGSVRCRVRVRGAQVREILVPAADFDRAASRLKVRVVRPSDPLEGD